jgi:hypothetical protein
MPNCPIMAVAAVLDHPAAMATTVEPPAKQQKLDKDQARKASV